MARERREAEGPRGRIPVTGQHRSRLFIASVLLILGALVGLIALVLFSNVRRGRASALVEAEFPDVEGLERGSPVYIYGVRAGEVASVRIAPPSDGERALVRVAMRIPAESARWLKRDAPVKIRKTAGGALAVWISEGEGPLLRDGERLRGTVSADLNAVADRAGELVSKAEKLVGEVSAVIGEIRKEGSLTGALSNLNALLTELRDEVGPLRVRVREILDETRAMLEENRLDVRHTVANLKETSALAKTFVEQLESTPERLHRSLAEVEGAAAAVESLLAENRSHIDTILEDLRTASTNAAALSAEMKRRPWRLFYRPSASEIRAMDLYDAAWAYNLGATELERTVRGLSDQLTRAARDGKQLESLKEAEAQVRQSLRRYREAEETFWEKLRAAE